MISLTQDVIAFCRMFATFEREQICCGAVSIAQCVLLQTLLEGEWDVTSLAQHTRVTKSAMTRLVDGLEKRGWVTRTKGEADGRRVVVTLHPDGKKEARRLQRRTEKTIETILAEIPADQRQGVIDSLRTLRQAVETARDQLDCCSRRAVRARPDPALPDPALPDPALPDPALPDDVVHRIHDRYLVEIVEGLRLCPFARKSREQGRVHRPVLRCDGTAPSPTAAAQALVDVARAHADAEIVLLTFVGNDARMATPAALDAYVRDVRDAYAAAADAPRPFFMVGFHRDSGQFPPGQEPALTPDSLVPMLRRTPDPVIQCVDTFTLERARATAQQAAHARMVETLSALNPALRAVAERSVSADSELSADIARANYEAVAHGEGRAQLEGRIAQILRERDSHG